MSGKGRLIHFGDKCHPCIVINHLLGQHRKSLFQLGSYPFNSILQILKEEKFEKMYTLPYLQGVVSGTDQVQRYHHANSEKEFVHNTHYGTILNHDFLVDENGCALNYEFIKRSFEEKIANFYHDLESDYQVFIHFCWNTDLKTKKFAEMCQVLVNQYRLKKFFIFVFTLASSLSDQSNRPEENDLTSQHVCLIPLELDYRLEWELTPVEREKVFREIYVAFLQTLKKCLLDTAEYPSVDKVIKKFFFSTK